MKKHRRDSVGKGALVATPIGEVRPELLPVLRELGGSRVVGGREPAISKTGGPAQSRVGSPATDPDRDRVLEGMRFEVCPRLPQLRDHLVEPLPPLLKRDADRLVVLGRGTGPSPNDHSPPGKQVDR